MTEPDESSAGDHRGPRALRRLARLPALGLTLLVVGSLIGQAARDRNVALALLMYIPLPMVGTIAVVLDLACRGRSYPRFRFGLSALGMLAIAWSVLTMSGSGTSERRSPGDREVSLMQWNVMWGGGPWRSLLTWAAQRGAIGRSQPDLIVLSEVPPTSWLERLVDDLGPGASFVATHGDPWASEWHGMAVFSRWPVRKEASVPLPGGWGMSVVAEVHGHPIRLLVVDGLSAPARSRLPFLRAIAEATRQAAAAGHPFDAVLGDFNTPSRSLGFDELEAQAYRLAGRSADGWRGTFPSWLPVYDIDHVWLAGRLRIGSCTFFDGPHSDHRGQNVRFFLPEEEPRP